MELVPISELISAKISGEWGKEPESENRVKILRTTNFTNDGKLNLSHVVDREVDEKKVRAKHLEKGDIIIEKSGGSPNQPVGRVVYFDIDDDKTYLCNNFTSILRPSNRILSKYLFYCLFYLHLTKKTLSYQNKTTGIINLQLNRYLNTVEIPLPSLENQKRVVKVIEDSDSLRLKRKSSIALLDEYLRSVFLTMFKDDDRLGRITFESLSADHKGSMRTGPFGSDLKHSEFVDSGVAVLGIDNAVKNQFAWNKKRFISQEKYEKLKRYTVHPRDVIVTIMGTTGRSAVIPDDIPLAINTKHLAAITFDETKANPYFMCYALQTDPRIKRQIAQRSKGAIMDGLNLTIIKNLELSSWPIELQNKFEVIYHKVQNLKQDMVTQSEAMETQFQALMQKAFTRTQ